MAGCFFVLLCAFHRYLWRTHYTWDSYTAVQVLLIPALVHLYTDKPAGDLLWTNLQVTYSGQTAGVLTVPFFLTNESTSNLTKLIRVDQSNSVTKYWTFERIR